jgi:hypothetical protein
MLIVIGMVIVILILAFVIYRNRIPVLAMLFLKQVNSNATWRTEDGNMRTGDYHDDEHTYVVAPSVHNPVLPDNSTCIETEKLRRHSAFFARNTLGTPCFSRYDLGSFGPFGSFVGLVDLETVGFPLGSPYRWMMLGVLRDFEKKMSQQPKQSEMERTEFGNWMPLNT